ncbi:hypothetical protein FACS189459_6690 [Bacilli bacterium]|nr:hypothetical protein FACS189459_6690 [Bacilli bacterium]
MSDVIANKQQRNLGTFSSVVFSVGNIVGIGVFFKNISIFKNNDFNPIGVLLV